MAHLEDAFKVSQRRACGVLGVDRTMVRYVSRRPDDAKARARIRELASERRRFGYRRFHWLLCREGWVMNHKKFRRLYRGEKLQVRRRWWPQACAWYQSAAQRAAGSEPALVTGFCVCCPRLWSQVPHSCGGR